MKTFDDYYVDVPVEQKTRLADFRATHPLQEARIQGTNWKYISCGTGEATILWLVGGLRVADAAYRSIPLMEDSFRIIAPTYPAVTTMAELVDGLAGLLKTEGIAQAHLLSGSFGGMVAQAFIRRYPDMADCVVLSTTTVPDPLLAERYRQQAQMLAAAPPELVASVSKPNFIQMIDPPEEERAFWTAYVDELFSERLGKNDQLSTIHCLLDFVDTYSLTPDDLADWAGRLLIIESEDDATFDADARERLRNLYPMAQVHTFEGGGHSPGTTRRDEFFNLVRNFYLR
jgi:pimeloyl-ACP methyl ester carboxylesterase